MVIGELLDYGIKALANIYKDANIIETYILLADVLKKDKTYILTHKNQIVSVENETLFKEYILSRKNNIPIAYITNKVFFMEFEFYIKEGVLIPRSDSEILIEQLLKLESRSKVLDLCCGSGVLGLTYALYFKDSKVDLVDISNKCIEVSTKNIKKYNLGNRVKTIKSDLFSNIKNTKYDLIISNPPYIIEDEIKTLDKDIKNYEPYIALNGGKDGLAFYKKIINSARNFLNDKGVLALEIGYNQKKDVINLLKYAEYTNIKIFKDYNKNDRVIIANI